MTNASPRGDVLHRFGAGLSAIGPTAAGAVRVLLGLAAEGVIFVLYGFGTATDAYFLAVAVPWILSRSLAAGSAPVLVPVLAAEQGERRGRLVTGLRTSGFCAFGVGVLIFSVASPLVGSAISARLHGATSAGTAGTLFAVLGVGHSFAFIVEALRAEWIARGRGAAAVMTDALLYAGVVVGVLVLRSSLGVWAIAVGTMAGFATQAIVLASVSPLALHVTGPRWAAVREVKAALIGILRVVPATALRRSTVPVERYVAAQSGAGGTSTIAYSGQIVNALAAVLGTVAATVVLPNVSGDMSHDERLRRLRPVTEFLVTVGLLASFSAALTAGALQFSDISSQFVQRAITANFFVCIGVMVWALPGMLLVQNLLLFFYGAGDTHEPARHMILTLLVHLLVAIGLGVSLGVVGLAIAFVLAGLYSVLRLRARVKRLCTERIYGFTRTGAIFGRSLLGGPPAALFGFVLAGEYRPTLAATGAIVGWAVGQFLIGSILAMRHPGSG